jgi:hypothetical protein
MPFYPVTQDPQQVLLSQVRGAFVRYDPPASLIAMVDPGSMVAHQCWAGDFRVGEFADAGWNLHNQESHNTARLKRKYAWHSK